MSYRVKLSQAALGIMLGVMTALALDMLFNNGPTCSAGCHGVVPSHAALSLR